MSKVIYAECSGIYTTVIKETEHWYKGYAEDGTLCWFHKENCKELDVLKTVRTQNLNLPFPVYVESDNFYLILDGLGVLRRVGKEDFIEEEVNMKESKRLTFSELDWSKAGSIYMMIENSGKEFGLITMHEHGGFVKTGTNVNIAQHVSLRRLSEATYVQIEPIKDWKDRQTGDIVYINGRDEAIFIAYRAHLDKPVVVEMEGRVFAAYAEDVYDCKIGE